MSRAEPSIADPTHAAADITATGGRSTPIREHVLTLLRSAGRPLSHDEVAKMLDAAGWVHDRVTLYRTLDWLVTKSLAHRVFGEDRVRRYNVTANQTHGHAHFHCGQCQRIWCLEHLQPAVAATLPAGFSLQRAELTFHGACPDCSAA